MISIRFKSFLIAIALSGACWIGLDVNSANADDNQTIQSSNSYFNNDYEVTHYTRYDMEQMLAHQNDAQFKMPNFKASKIRNLISAKDEFHVGQIGQQLDVWDSWPLKTASGKVANFYGYNVTFALTGNTNDPSTPNNIGHCKIYMFYQKVNDANKGTKSWHSAGPVFESNTEGAKNPSKLLKNEAGEWAGSTVLQKDGRARLFYTSSANGSRAQTLATASIKIDVTSNGLTINHQETRDRKLIFAGDGKYYETLAQSNAFRKAYPNDDHCLRDPNYVEANGHKYLLFDANTGSNFGKEGTDQLNNTANLGGNSDFQNAQQSLFASNSDIKNNAASANGAIGIIELNNHYRVKKIMKPLVVFNAVDDEAERPSIIRYHHKWYLFTTTHGWHLTAPNMGIDDGFMLGFSSKQFTGSYKPLNKYGLVLHADQPTSKRTYSYSYGVIQGSHDPFVINYYMSAIGNKENGYAATFGPSVLLSINGNNTSIMQWPTLSQGQTTYTTSVFAKK